MIRRSQFVAARKLIMPHTGQVNGGTLTTMDGFHGAVVILAATDTDFDRARLDYKLIAHRRLSARGATGDNRAVSGDCKSAINRHAKRCL